MKGRHILGWKDHRSAKLAVAATIVAGAMSAGIGSTADAGTGSPQAQRAKSSVSHVRPMYLTRAVRQLSRHPDRTGKVRVKLANGQVIAIQASHAKLVMRAAAQRRDTATAANRLSGNCGSSYIFVNHLSDGHPVHMDTGFDVNHPAVEYAWHAYIAGDSHTGYDYEYHASGWLNFRVGWHGQHSSHKDYPHGTYAAWVYNDGSSWALLDNGSFCVSAGPWDDRYL